ncbi:hypothetical protein RBTH_07597 [Bacillus thuringiensis serovar israelensis ATCC 35646]|nr:hypothetical protein RBTH_07597 [Bacillus thuringiensis serovar israelensis ATCC 35646]
MVLLQLVTKKKLLTVVDNDGYWKGVFAPCKIRKTYVNDNHPSCTEVLIQKIKYTNGEIKTLVKTVRNPYGKELELEEFIENFIFHHCNEEDGINIKYWQLA